jgi:Tfp pilus assembly protein PilV
MIKNGFRSERGISLIETAIAVLIISLLVFPMLKLMEVGRESRLKQEGIERNTAVIASLKRYWMDNGRLPRPASTYSIQGDSDLWARSVNG